MKLVRMISGLMASVISAWCVMFSSPGTGCNYLEEGYAITSGTNEELASIALNESLITTSLVQPTIGSTTTTEPFRVNPVSIILSVGDQCSLSTNRNDVSYKAVNPEIALVSSDGIITAVRAGVATVFVSSTTVQYPVPIYVEVHAATTLSTTITTAKTTTITSTTVSRTTSLEDYWRTTTGYRAITTVGYRATTAATVKAMNLQEGMKKFDINMDSRVNISDAVLLTRFVSEDETTVLPRTSEPDVNADGIVTIQDVIAVLNALQPFSIQVGKAAAKPGTKVTVPIRIFADKGTAGGQVYVNYNTKLTPISVKSGDAYTMNFTSDSNGYPITISWTTMNGKNQIAPNGSILAYLEFEIDSNIKTTEYLEIEIVNQAGTGYLTSFEDSSGFSYTASYKSGYITAVP